jgi:hypothetical protein
METRRNTGALIWGLVLVALGVLFTLQQLRLLPFEWGNIWPGFIIVAGLAFLLGYALSPRHDAGLAFVGSMAVMTGVFLGLFAFGYYEWSQMAYMWGWWPLMGGIAFVILWAADRFQDWGVLVPAVIGIGVGIIALAGGNQWYKYWPVAVILAGIVVLVGAFARKGSHS